MSDELLVQPREGYELWTLNRPARRNAVGLEAIAALDAARAAAVASGVSVVVLGAAGDVFCAGFDLGDLRRIGVQGGALPTSPLHDLFDRFTPLPFTLITAIQGPAYGGGVELALLGDLRVAAPGASFVLPPSRLGIVYPAQGVARLSGALGPSLLRAMLVTAEPVDARRLWQAGALWALDDDPLAAACALASRVAALPAQARLANAALVYRGSV